MTLATWQFLKIVDAVRKSGGKLTSVMLANLGRGLQGGSFEVSQGGRGPGGHWKICESSAICLRVACESLKIICEQPESSCEQLESTVVFASM